MPSLHQDPKSKRYRVMFRYGGRQYQKGLKTTDEQEANGLKGRIELTLLELERGRKTLPPGADLWEFLKSDGQRTQKVEAPNVVTLLTLFEQFESEMPAGAMENNSLGTILIHKKHLLRLLGTKTAVNTLATTDLQRYINKRAKEKYRGKVLKARTIKKEVNTFGQVWKWSKLHGLVAGDSPTHGLRYEKEDEKPGFMTWEEIERRVKRGGLTAAQESNLWEALFLSKEQIADCLKHVQATATLPFSFPMFVFIAHTGARRSEMARSQVEDFDFVTKKIRIREKKRVRNKKESSRYVDMSPLLEKVMKDWVASAHPGGLYTFCLGDTLLRSRKRSMTTGHQSGSARSTTKFGRQRTIRERTERPGHLPLTWGEASDHFKRTLTGTKWAVIRGFHVFRHSLASNLAMAGVRQEVIDGWLGHQTEEMRRRYRHLFPQETQDAMQRVFGR